MVKNYGGDLFSFMFLWWIQHEIKSVLVIKNPWGEVPSDKVSHTETFSLLLPDNNANAVNDALSVLFLGSKIQWWNWQANWIQDKIITVHAYPKQWGWDYRCGPSDK